MSNVVIEVSNLCVNYGRGKTLTHAVEGISFQVSEGECVGFIGVNGAGKSTTIKTLMGFHFASSGEARVWGEPAGTPESRARTGYLPEVALYYPYMKARELLELYGGLDGMNRKTLKERIPSVLKAVGLDGKSEILLKKFSKGMQQRLGIAQSIISEPDLFIFDELTSGLDPVGRFTLRSLLLDLKNKGKTIFFSSHELAEVECLCDRVLIIHQGKLLRDVSLRALQEEGGEKGVEAFFIDLIQNEGGKL